MRRKNAIEYLQSIETYWWDPGKTGQNFIPASRDHIITTRTLHLCKDVIKQFLSHDRKQ